MDLPINYYFISSVMLPPARFFPKTGEPLSRAPLCKSPNHASWSHTKSSTAMQEAEEPSTKLPSRSPLDGPAPPPYHHHHYGTFLPPPPPQQQQQQKPDGAASNHPFPAGRWPLFLPALPSVLALLMLWKLETEIWLVPNAVFSGYAAQGVVAFPCTVQQLVLVEGVPIREPPLPFCGIGLGWIL